MNEVISEPLTNLIQKCNDLKRSMIKNSYSPHNYKAAITDYYRSLTSNTQVAGFNSDITTLSNEIYNLRLIVDSTAAAYWFKLLFVDFPYPLA